MSRTTHHREYYKRNPEMAWSYGTEEVPATYTHIDWYTKEVRTCLGTCRMDIAGFKPKKKKKGFYPRHWSHATPSWWVHDFMTTPKRAACRNWEKDAVKHYDLEEIPICPDHGRKPHAYYW